MCLLLKSSRSSKKLKRFGAHTVPWRQLNSAICSPVFSDAGDISLLRNLGSVCTTPPNLLCRLPRLVSRRHHRLAKRTSSPPSPCFSPPPFCQTYFVASLAVSLVSTIVLPNVLCRLPRRVSRLAASIHLPGNRRQVMYCWP